MKQIKKELNELPGFNKTLNYLRENSINICFINRSFELRQCLNGRLFILSCYDDCNGFEIFYPESSQDLELVENHFGLYCDSKSEVKNET